MIYLLINTILLFSSPNLIKSFHFTKNNLTIKLLGNYCTRKLDINGAYGCASSWNGADGKLVFYKNTQDFLTKMKWRNKEVIALMEHNFFSHKTIKFLESYYNLQGVIVIPKVNLPNSQYYSVYFDFYDPKSVTSKTYNFPIYLLESDIIKSFDTDKMFVRLKSEMLAKTNSLDCIRQKTCMPVVSHTVWSTYHTSDLKKTKFLILSAYLSSKSIFATKSRGKSTSTAGLAILLSIAKTIKESKHMEAIAKNKKLSLLYAAFDSEENGWLGSNWFAHYIGEFKCEQNVDHIFCRKPLLDNFDTFSKLKAENLAAILDLNQFEFIASNGKNIAKLRGYFGVKRTDQLMLDLIAEFALNLRQRGIELDLINFDNLKNAPNSSAKSFLSRSPKFLGLSALILTDTSDKIVDLDGRNKPGDFDVDIDKERLVDISTALYKALLKTVFGVLNVEGDVSIRTLDLVLDCLNQNKCDGISGGIKIRSEQQNRAFQQNVFNALSVATSVDISDQNIACKDNTCVLGDFRVWLDQRWCVENQEGVSHCFVSPTYLLSALDPGFYYDSEKDVWGIDKDKSWSLITESLYRADIAKLYDREDDLVVYVLLAVGPFLVAAGLVVGYLCQSRLIKRYFE